MYVGSPMQSAGAEMSYPDLEAPSSSIIVLLLQYLSWLWRRAQRGLSLPLQALRGLAHPTHPQ